MFKLAVILNTIKAGGKIYPSVDIAGLTAQTSEGTGSAYIYNGDYTKCIAVVKTSNKKDIETLSTLIEKAGNEAIEPNEELEKQFPKFTAIYNSDGAVNTHAS